MTDNLERIVGECVEVSLDTSIWRIFDMKVPHHGALINKFRKRWRVSLEKHLVSELFTIALSAFVIAGKASQAHAIEAINYLVSSQAIANSFGHSSQQEALIHLRTALDQYMSRNPRQWPTLLQSRLSIISIPDKTEQARLVAGCAMFGSIIGNMILGLRNRK